VLVSLYLAVALTGLFIAHVRAPNELAIAGNRVLRVYAPMAGVQLMLVGYVSRVARPEGTLTALMGAPWSTPRRAAEDLAIAVAGWIALTAIEVAWSRLVPNARVGSSAVLPITAGERLAWIAVASSVAFGEEVVFRGYLQTQFAARLGDRRVAIMLQAALFGLAHAEQGFAAALRIALYGVGLGAIAQWRRSLRPCIACHALTDLASGLWRI
jgi:membrane protease YdiL (CAAX protease family)